MTNEASSMCCECTPVEETRFGGERGRLPSVAIVEAVAAVEGVAPTDLDHLYETIDPDMIDRMFVKNRDAARPPIFLRLSVDGWNVFIHGDGAIRVCEPDRLSDPAPVFQKPLSH